MLPIDTFSHNALDFFFLDNLSLIKFLFPDDKYARRQENGDRKPQQSFYETFYNRFFFTIDYK